MAVRDLKKCKSYAIKGRCRVLFWLIDYAPLYDKGMNPTLLSGKKSEKNHVEIEILFMSKRCRPPLWTEKMVSIFHYTPLSTHSPLCLTEGKIWMPLWIFPSFELVGDTTATTHLLHLELTCPYVICLYYIQTIASIIYIKRHTEKSLLFCLD